MKKLLFTLPLVLMLSACGTIADGQSQLVTVKTPGAENAKCILENKDLKVTAYTDQTVRVMKSPHDLVVRCQAPGNREQTILVKRDINEWSVWNVANGFVPGVTYDYFSRGLFSYPDVLTVSFSGMKAKQYSAPDYESQDLCGGTPDRDLPCRHNVAQEPPLLKKRVQNFNDFSPAAGGNSIHTVTDELGVRNKSYYQSAIPSVSYDPTEEDK